MQIVIVGGGPAGMLAAIAASENTNNNVILIEKNEKLGKKIFITGKGRGNVTNDCSKEEFFKNIVTNSKFLFSSFNEFSNVDFIKLLNDNGLDTKVERGNRVFPISDKAYEITDCLKNIMKKNNVKVMLNTKLVGINADTKVNSIKCKEINTNKVLELNVDRLIIATGGLSYPQTGSTGDGYTFAKNLGINVKDLRPSLVPIIVEEKSDLKKASGLTLKNVAIKIYKDLKSFHKPIYEDFGELYFDESYLDGAIILSASAYLNDYPYLLSIDLKPALTHDQLDSRILRELENNHKATIDDILKTLLPIDLIDVIKERLEKILILSDLSNLKKDDRLKIVNLLKNFTFTLKKSAGFDDAIITKGGVDVKEIDPKTMESKKIKGLYFVGEVLDIDCLTGGFNMQVAASTGYTAGKHVV